MAAKLTASISSVKNCISRYEVEGNTRNIHGWTKKNLRPFQLYSRVEPFRASQADNQCPLMIAPLTTYQNFHIRIRFSILLAHGFYFKSFTIFI